MKDGKKGIVYLILSILVGIVLAVVAVLLSYLAPRYKKLDNANASAKVEYTPKSAADRNILLTGIDIPFDTLLMFDFEKQSVSAIIFESRYDYRKNYSVDKTVTVSCDTVIALCDGSGGVNTAVLADGYGFCRGNWKLTGSQFCELLSVSDGAQKECLISDFFANVFTKGLQNEQISIILEYNSGSVTYLDLHDIAVQIDDGLENTSVSFEQ